MQVYLFWSSPTFEHVAERFMLVIDVLFFQLESWIILIFCLKILYTYKFLGAMGFCLLFVGKMNVKTELEGTAALDVGPCASDSRGISLLSISSLHFSGGLA